MKAVHVYRTYGARAYVRGLAAVLRASGSYGVLESFTFAEEMTKSLEGEIFDPGVMAMEINEYLHRAIVAREEVWKRYYSGNCG